MSHPEVAPGYREHVPAIGDYELKAAVWVWSAGAWQKGVVQSRGPLAVLVLYWPAGCRGSLVDSFVADNIMPRTDPEGTGT